MKHITGRFWLGLIFVLLLNIGYRWLSIPPADLWEAYTLRLTPHGQELIETTLATEPWRLFLPLDHGGGGRFAWNPTKALPVYYLSTIMSPSSLFVFLTSFMVMSLYLAAYVSTRSLRFALALGIIAAFSTFLNYTFVYGSIMRNYLVIAYLALTAVCLIRYILSESNRSKKWFTAFVLSSMLVIFSGEHWINLCLSFLLGSVFVLLWARRHNQTVLATRFRNVGIFLSLALVAYLAVRLQYANTYFRPGFENEMIFTHASWLLKFEDIIVNYLTYVHITLSGVLPGFMTFSPSYTALGPEIILAQQHGYHEQYSHLVINSHLTSWRFIGGMLFAGLLGTIWYFVKTAWQSDNVQNVVPVILILIVATAFVTHLPIKMRPMHLTAMLGYKTLMSSTALMVLLAWLVYISAEWNVAKVFRKAFVSVVMGSVILAAFTRPAIHQAGLNAVGLDSAGDPIVKIKRLLN